MELASYVSQHLVENESSKKKAIPNLSVLSLNLIPFILISALSL
jgi:hypothetical protein